MLPFRFILPLGKLSAASNFQNCLLRIPRIKSNKGLSYLSPRVASVRPLKGFWGPPMVSVWGMPPPCPQDNSL